MLRIGAIGWGECGQCVHYDEEDGCQVLDKIEIEREDETVFCVDGIKAEERSE